MAGALQEEVKTLEIGVVAHPPVDVGDRFDLLGRAMNRENSLDLLVHLFCGVIWTFARGIIDARVGFH